MASAFPDGYVHLGGDEVPFDCWLVSCHPRALELGFGIEGDSLQSTVTCRSGHLAMRRDLLKKAVQSGPACLTFDISICQRNAFPPMHSVSIYFSLCTSSLLALRALLTGSCPCLRLAGTCQ